MAVGLATYQWNNQLKSILLLMGFPFLLVLMVWGYFFTLDLWWQAHPEMYNIIYRFQPQAEGGYGDGYGPVMGHAAHAAFSGTAQYGIYAIGVALAWFVIAYFFHNNLLRLATHSQPITRAQMPRLYNLLENLCISRGIPMPQFEIIDSPALNAFATGIDEKSYRIVLTRGIVDTLHDDELESVIGHELTHIINRDVRLLMVAVIFAGMLSFFAQLVYRGLVHGWRPNYYSRGSSGGGSRDRGNGAVIVVLVALAILVLGYVFALLIRFALSRKREFLADAGSVELTKNPEAMMKALLRISGQDTVTGMPNEVQQMCIENSHEFMGIFATHPPLEDRIRAISETTNTPVPNLRVSLRRAPDGPWSGGRPPGAQEAA